MEIKSEGLDTLKPTLYIGYEQLHGETKTFIDDIIWNCAFAKADLMDVPIKNMLYPKYKEIIQSDPKYKKIKDQFDGKKSYGGDIVKNLQIQLNWATPEQAGLMKEIIADFDNNRRVYEEHAIICSVLISSLKTDTQFKTIFEKCGIDVVMINKILGVEDKYYGGLGAYNERWDEIKSLICPPNTNSEILSPNKITNYVFNSENGQYILGCLLLMLKEKYGCEISSLEAGLTPKQIY